jgi:hypothetical protein
VRGTLAGERRREFLSLVTRHSSTFPAGESAL